MSSGSCDFNLDFCAAMLQAGRAHSWPQAHGAWYRKFFQKAFFFQQWDTSDFFCNTGCSTFCGRACQGLTLSVALWGLCRGEDLERSRHRLSLHLERTGASNAASCTAVGGDGMPVRLWCCTCSLQSLGCHVKHDIHPLIVTRGEPGSASALQQLFTRRFAESGKGGGQVS